MTLKDIAFASLKRQKKKNFFLFFLIMIGCSAVLSLYIFLDSKKNAIDKQFDEYGANIIVTPKTDQLPLNYGGVNMSSVITDIKKLQKGDEKKIRTIPFKANIRVVSPKYLVTNNLSYNGVSRKVLLVGVNFKDEINIKSWWKINGDKPTDNNSLVFGSEVAQFFKISSGQQIKFKNTNFKVAGILSSTGSQDDFVIFGNITKFQKVFQNKGQISLIEVSALCGDCPIDDLVSQISKKLPNANVKSIKKVMKQKMDVVNQFQNFAFLLTIMIIIVATIIIFTSMTSSLFSRLHELGIFRAIGFSKNHIMKVILIESLLVCFAAAIMGGILTLISVYTILPQISGLSLKTVQVNFYYFPLSIVSVVFIGFLGTLRPAVKASNVDPVIVLKSI